MIEDVVLLQQNLVYWQEQIVLKGRCLEMESVPEM